MKQQKLYPVFMVIVLLGLIFYSPGASASIIHLSSSDGFELNTLSDPIIPMDVTIIVTPVTCPGGDDGTIKVIMNGVKPFNICLTYGCEPAMEGMFTEPPKTQTATYTGLIAGYYLVTVTDGQGMQYVECVLVPEPDPVGLELVEHINPSCYTFTDGMIKYEITGGVPPFTTTMGVIDFPYLIISGLGDGDYSVTVTDFCGYITKEFSMVEPDELLAEVSPEGTNMVSCHGGDDGQITIIISGGTPPYYYPEGIVFDGNTLVFDYLIAGIYSFTIYDDNGCYVTIENFEITEPEYPLAANINVIQQVSCYGGSNAQAELVITGGTLPYSHDFTGDLNALSAGNYTILVTDANGCGPVEVNFTITEPYELEAYVVQDEITDASCFEAEDGQVVIEITGGTAPYTADMGVVVGNVLTISGLAAGQYAVEIDDYYECGPVTVVFVIGEPELLQATYNIINHVSCFGGSDGSVEILPSGGTPPYTITGTITGLFAGEHTVSVTDANNCGPVEVTFTITEPLLLEATAVVIQNVSCYGGNDGEVEIIPVGGTPPYTITGPTTGLAAGVHTVSVTDSKNCGPAIVTFEITQPEELQASATVIKHVNCFGGADGQAELIISGGTPPYSHDFDGDLNALAAGTYTIMVTDDNDCDPVEVTFTINEPDLLQAHVAEEGLIPASCHDSNDGQATIQITGGTPPYYADGEEIVGNILVISDLLAGHYSVTITDANECGPVVVAFTIDAPDALAVIISGTTVLPCNLETPVGTGDCFGFAVLEFNQGLRKNGTPVLPERSNPLKALGQPSMNNADGEFVSLGFGGHIVLAFEYPILNGPGPDIMVYETSFGSPNCNVWPETVAVYAAMVYEGVDTDWVYLGEGCQNTAFDLGSLPYAEVVKLLDVSDPAAFGSTADGYDVDGIVCLNGFANAAYIAAHVTGGTLDYSYNWQKLHEGVWVDLDSFGAMLQVLEPGDYRVIITDAHLCTITSEVWTVTEPDPIVANPVFVLPVCYVDAVAVTVDAFGGTGTLKLYDWVDSQLVFVSELPLAEPLMLASGQYNWVVKDANGCQATMYFEIVIPAEIFATIEYDPIECFGETTAVLVEGNGGTGILNLWDIGGEIPVLVGPLPQTVNVYAGPINWKVVDENGCEFLINDYLTQPTELEAWVADGGITDVTCFEGSDGSALIYIQGGTPPYSADMGVMNNGNYLLITNLSAGTYTVNITDSKNCGPEAVTFTIADGTPINIVIIATSDALCFGQPGGTIEALATGGNGGFMYSIDNENWQESGLFEYLMAGTYTIYVKDQENCTASYEGIIITEPAELVVELDVYDVTCFGAKNGKIVGLIYGGVGPYNVCLLTYCHINGDDNGTYEKSQNFMHWNLEPGQYMIKVTDQNGCEWIQCVTIYEPELLVAEILEWTNVLCYGEATGEATVEVWGGNGGYMFLWSDGQTTQTAVGLAAGEYSVTVTDEKGCIATATVIITQPMEPLSFTYTVGHVLCYGEAEGSIQIHPVGGTGEYSISGIDALFVQNLFAGNYEVTLTDENGCFVTQTITVDQPDALTVAIFVDELECHGDGVLAYVHDWVWYRQGLTKVGNLPNADRSDPDNIIGEPVYGDVLGTFFSLGFGGEMIVKFEAPFVNGGEGVFDLKIVETTFGNHTCNTYPEKVQVWVAQYINEALYTPVQSIIDVLQLGDTWYYLGEYCLDALIELGDLPWAQYVYMKDVSNPADFSNSQTSDGYDINGLIALNGLLTVTADVTAIPAGGVAPYSYLWNTGETTQKLVGIGPGEYWVTITDYNGCTVMSQSVLVECDWTEVDNTDKPMAGDNMLKLDDMLSVRAYPNPFRDMVTIEFETSESSHVIVEIYNMVGERIDEVFQGYVDASSLQKVTFRAGNLPPGMYFYNISTSRGTHFNKLILSK
jgi:hypothetical protein